VCSSPFQDLGLRNEERAQEVSVGAPLDVALKHVEDVKFGRIINVLDLPVAPNTLDDHGLK
jgi:hypothetical protein